MASVGTRFRRFVYQRPRSLLTAKVSVEAILIHAQKHAFAGDPSLRMLCADDAEKTKQPTFAVDPIMGKIFSGVLRISEMFVPLQYKS